MFVIFMNDTIYTTGMTCTYIYIPVHTHFFENIFFENTQKKIDILFINTIYIYYDTHRARDKLFIRICISLYISLSI